jgi:hypothetical protein
MTAGGRGCTFRPVRVVRWLTPRRAAHTRRRPSAPSGPDLVVNTKPLTGIPAIRNFFRTTQAPVYFVSATAFNLLGIDRWVRTFKFINYYDSFDGWHPNVFVPREQSPRAFGSIEEIVNYLLGHKEVADLVSAHGPGKAAFLMFDGETEQLADELRLDVVFPPASLRHRLDSKIETTRLGDEAGVPSVPNTMGTATTYPELISLAKSGGLGDDLVVQTPYGDSGQTTFFIADGRDWDRHERKVAGEQLKVMKRIEPRELAIEGVITRHGTLVGPLMAELVGFEELSRPTTVAGAATTYHPTSSRRSSDVTPANGRSRWANGCDGRATEGTSSLTSSWTPERATFGSVS